MKLERIELFTKPHRIDFDKIHSMRKWYMDSYADFGGDIGKIYDWQVADYAKKHLRFFDRFNMRKVSTAMQWSFSILSKSIEEPTIKNGKWKFFKDF